ncbi:MAG: M23 family metallopeptidase [Eubacterium sp.]|nr:M23 family metallopeptidase [Eubacterium sp.]
MMKPSRFKCIVLIELLTLFAIVFFSHPFRLVQELFSAHSANAPVSSQNAESESGSNTAGKDFIKWVDFHVTSAAMNDAYQYDLKAHDTDTPIDWVCLLAILGAKYGGDFKNYKSADMDTIAGKILNKESTLEELTQDMKYYDYYNEAYHAVLGGFVGEYQLPGADTEKQYGLKAFSPIAKGFPYTDYDDFGSSRSFGYRRQHLGHDMMGQIGTPIIAVESGYVECLGWNRYGGWRIGIRSFDQKRYYYYAHLRQNFPYNKSLKEGSLVTAGDVIGYMGHTGYSDKENVNNIDIIHLHFGLQLIFDESQKDGNGEIWISCYELARFLSQNRSETVKDESTKEWHRVQEMIDPAVEEYAGREASAEKEM